MYAVFVEVNADESATEDARKRINETVAPAVRERGAKAGYWLAPQGGRGVSIVVFESEDVLSPSRRWAFSASMLLPILTATSLP